MAGASSIPSLVKSHPISLKDNLVLICCEAGIDLDTKDTKNSLQIKITEFSDKSKENESKIREAIDQIKGKTPPKDTRKKTLPLDESLSQSQCLFSPTQGKTNGVSISEHDVSSATQNDESSLNNSFVEHAMSQTAVLTLLSKVLKTKDEEIKAKNEHIKALNVANLSVTEKFQETAQMVLILADERKDLFSSLKIQQTERVKQISELHTKLDNLSSLTTSMRLEIEELRKPTTSTSPLNSSPPNPSPPNLSPPNPSPPNPSPQIFSPPNPPPPKPSPPNPSTGITPAGQWPSASTRDQYSSRTSPMTSGSNPNVSHHNSSGEKRKTKLLLITDSNGKYLNPKRLKSEAYGVKYDRYTTAEAIDKMPKVSDPKEVTDVVFQVGYNDLRGGSTPEEVQEKVLEVQLAYNQQYPNARQHITAVPPVDDNHMELCKQLQKLSTFTECNFVSTNVFKDKTSGKLRSGMTDVTSSGVHHYTEWGLKILAKEIKKSLYSTANSINTRLPRMRMIRQDKTKAPASLNNE